jgi:hypothetical protein
LDMRYLKKVGSFRIFFNQPIKGQRAEKIMMQMPYAPSGSRLLAQRFHQLQGFGYSQ